MKNYTYLKNYQPAPFQVKNIRLEFDLDPAETRVQSWLEIENLTAPLFLHGEDLQLCRVQINAEILSPEDYQLSDDGITINTSERNFILHIIVKIVPKTNTRLEGLYSTSGHMLTQCEAEGFRRITYYPDRPDILTRFHVTLRADYRQYPLLLAGGNWVSAQKLDHHWHQVEFYDPHPKPCYLFALVAGKFETRTDKFITAQGREVTLCIHVDVGNYAQSEFAMHALQSAMRWDEENYNFCYDLEHYHIVVANDFNMGAMENKGLNIFNARLVLASSDTATDDDYDRIDAVIAHEYFHNWTGNRITCRDWFQLSLKEGLTVFREQQYGQDRTSKFLRRIQDVSFLRMRQFPEDAGATAHSVRPECYLEINNFYTATIYEKGAELINMLYHIVGREQYYQGIELYRNRHDGTAATCDDFLAAMQAVTDQDLTQFHLWYQQSGTPEITVETHWHEDHANDSFGSLEIVLTQNTATAQNCEQLPVMIPLQMAIWDENKVQLPLKLAGGQQEYQNMILLRKATQSFTFLQIPKNAILSLNRGFSAPVKLQGVFDWQAIARFDNDDFNRWDAKENLIKQWFCDYLQGKRNFADIQANLVNLFQDLLKLDQEPALWTLPAISNYISGVAVFDPEACHHLLSACQLFVAENFQNQLQDIYTENYLKLKQDKIQRSAAQDKIQRRAAHGALGYLALLEPELLVRHYYQARNMTESFTALQIAQKDKLSNVRFELMADFANQWQDNPLVMNKWLSLQGGVIVANNLANVQNIITQEQYFTLTNPNNVYALLGQFVTAMGDYHRLDGQGYQFFGEICQKIDTLNPQVSARLLAMGLMHSQKLSNLRQDLLKDMLTNLLEAKNISPDMFEIARSNLAMFTQK